MSTKITKADLIANIIAAGTDLTESALRRKTVEDLEALLADLGCGGCDNDDHCGACECCEEAETATLPADDAAAAEFTAEPAEQPEFAADATKDWRGNYNTVFAPAAEAIAAGYAKVEVRTVNVSTMLRQTDIAGPLAKEFLDLLVAMEAAALAAMKTWQKTLDRRDATDMEKFNENRSFLAGYLASAAQRMTGSKKMPCVAFAKDMDRALRPEALTAGAKAEKAAA
jgi:hypothetical protein